MNAIAPSLRRPRRAVVALLALALAAVVTPTPPPVEADPPASFRLLAANRTVTLERYGQQVRLDLGVLAASVGGAVELKAARSTWRSPIALEQVEPTTKDVVRRLPATMLDGFRGLTKFARIIIRDSSGRVVKKVPLTFCPNTYGRQRTDDQGPPVSAYPDMCGGYMPFTKGAVWGIDAGWASPLASDWEAPSVGLASGRYAMKVKIAKRYREAFAVRAEDAAVDLDVTVRQRRQGRQGANSVGSPVRYPEPGPERDVPILDTPDRATLPDLAALPAFNIQIERRHQRDLLSFAANEWNQGPAPLVVEGFRRPDSDVMDAYQYFYDRAGNAVGRAPAGTMEYHDARGHHHWHFLQFASYTLVHAKTGAVVRSRKQAFCIVPTDPVDLTVAGAQMNGFNVGLYSACGGRSAIWVREALPTGWGDTYYQSRAGQAFNISDLPNGRYRVKVRVDPEGQFRQTSTGNDVASRRLTLGGEPGARTVVVKPWRGISEPDGFHEPPDW